MCWWWGIYWCVLTVNTVGRVFGGGVVARYSMVCVYDVVLGVGVYGVVLGTTIVYSYIIT